MKRKTRAFVLSACLVLIAAGSGIRIIPGQQAPITAEYLWKVFFDALNSKDEAKLRDFLVRHSVGTRPLEQRLAMLKDLADAFAPLEVARPSTVTEDGVRVLLKTGGGESLGFILEVQKGPELKMKGLRIGPPAILDEPPAKDYTGWKDLASLCAAIRKDTNVPAMGIAVIREGTLEQSVAGVRVGGGSDAVLADDPWSIGSIGKPICSTIIGRLVELGKLQWDLTLSEALDGLPMNLAYRMVTIEQLLQHRGGVPEDLGFDLDRVRAIVADATDPIKMRENYARDILGRDPVAAPGRFVYSNAGYALLGVIAERTMNLPYETLVRQLVFEPLGLHHSYTGADKLPESRPSGHVPGPSGLRRENLSGPLEFIMAPAGGGLFMSVADLARFGAAHLEGLWGRDGLLKAATVQHLHQGLPEDPGGRLYGCGWAIEELLGIETMHTHNGSNGTFRSQLAIFPKANLVVAALVNSGGESDPSPPLQAVLAIAGRYAAADSGK